MKEELQGKLVEILTSIQTATGKASDFAMAQLPDVAQSYVAYGRALYTSLVVLAALLLACAAACFWLAWRSHARGDEEYTAAAAKHKEDEAKNPTRYIGLGPRRYEFEDGGGLRFATIFLFMPGAALAVICLPSFLMTWFAPKVWLLKELASFLK